MARAPARRSLGSSRRAQRVGPSTRRRSGAFRRGHRPRGNEPVRGARDVALRRRLVSATLARLGGSSETPRTALCCGIRCGPRMAAPHDSTRPTPKYRFAQGAVGPGRYKRLVGKVAGHLPVPGLLSYTVAERAVALPRLNRQAGRRGRAPRYLLLASRWVWRLTLTTDVVEFEAGDELPHARVADAKQLAQLDH